MTGPVTRNMAEALRRTWEATPDPKIVVAVLLEFGEHGYMAARVASKMIERYLKTTIIQPVNVTGG